MATPTTAPFLSTVHPKHSRYPPSWLNRSLTSRSMIHSTTPFSNNSKHSPLTAPRMKQTENHNLLATLFLRQLGVDLAGIRLATRNPGNPKFLIRCNNQLVFLHLVQSVFTVEILQMNCKENNVVGFAAQEVVVTMQGGHETCPKRFRAVERSFGWSRRLAETNEVQAQVSG